MHGFTESIRHDLVGSPLRVTHIAPGLAKTEFSIVRFKKNESQADKVYENILPLLADDIADATFYAASRPEHVQIGDIKLWCTNQSGPRDIVRAGSNLGRI